MSLCEPVETLQRLLAGSLPADQALPVRQHVSICPHCQAALDRLSEDPELPGWAVEARGLGLAAHDRTDLVGLLQTLRETPGPADGPGPATALEFLGPPEQPGDLGTLGPYRVLAELGRGGMGIVLKAFDRELSRTVALKVLRRERIDDQARARFVREARAAAGLNHDHVVPVHAVVNPPDAPPYLVMPFVPGPTLRERILSERGLDPRVAAAICAEVADGLTAAHGAGLIHRDIKPANIILDSEHRRARIMDFGLVRVRQQSGGTTQEGTIPGTPEYMSPEQIRTPDDIDERSDVYSLGVTLYEALTGAVPFRGTPYMVLQQVLRDEPLPPRRLSDRVSRDLETICLKAMAKEPGRRYAGAAEVRDDLRRWLAGEPIQARPVGQVERLWRWCGRNPALAALTAAAAGLLVLVAVVACVGYLAESAQRAAAVRAQQHAQAQQTLAQAATEKARAEAAWSRRLLFDADMQLAAQLWESETGTAKAIADLLEAHAPKEDGVDLRDFAYRYQENLLRRAIVIGGHTGWCTVSLTPDGSLVTSDEAREVRFWGKVSRRTIRPKSSSTLPVCVCGATSPDGSTIACGTPIGIIGLREVPSGRQRTLQAWVPVVGVAFSGDGTKLVSVHLDNRAKLWDLATGTVLDTLTLATYRFREMALSRDGKTLVLANHPGNAEMSVVRFGEKGTRTLREQGATVTCVAFSPDGKTLASGDSHVILWDAQTWNVLGRVYPKGGWVTHVAFSPDSGRLASGGSDGLITLWDAQERRQLLRLKGHTAQVTNLAFSADSKLASGSVDGTARLWDLADLEEGRMLGGVAAGLKCPAYSPDGNWLATGGARVRLWDAQTEKVALEFDGDSACVVFSPDSTLLAAAWGTRIQLWDVARGFLVRTLEGRSPAPDAARKSVAALSFSPDGKLLAAGFGAPNQFRGNYNQIAQVWRVESGEEVGTLPHSNTVPAVAFFPDGDVLATACHDGSVRLWQVSTWEQLRALAGPDAVPSLAVSPRSPVLAAGSWKGEVRVWDGLTGKQLLTLPGHANTVYSLAFSPDAKTLASTGLDRTIKLWDVVSGRELRTLAKHTRWVLSLAFSPDGATLASSGQDGSLRLWETSPRDADTRAVARLERLVAAFPGNLPYRHRLAESHSNLGHQLGEEGSYAEAAEAFRKAIDLNPDAPSLWYSLAVAHLGADDREAYRKVCAAMRERFDKTTDPGVAARVLYACVPGADAVADPKRLVALADVAEPDPKGDTRLHGVALYRAGRWAESIALIARGSQGRAWDWLFQAMAHHRLGDRAEAKRCLDKAVVWMTVSRPHWTERVEGRALRDEAEKLMSGAPR